MQCSPFCYNNLITMTLFCVLFSCVYVSVFCPWATNKCCCYKCIVCPALWFHVVICFAHHNQNHRHHYQTNGIFGHATKQYFVYAAHNTSEVMSIVLLRECSAAWREYFDVNSVKNYMATQIFLEPTIVYMTINH